MNEERTGVYEKENISVVMCDTYIIELEVKDTTYTDRSVSYLDLHLEIDIEEGLRTKFPDNKKRFKFSHCELSIYLSVYVVSFTSSSMGWMPSTKSPNLEI
jgi:hypothetical protein